MGSFGDPLEMVEMAGGLPGTVDRLLHGLGDVYPGFVGGTGPVVGGLDPEDGGYG